jgi:modification target Cys-rich repeat protein
MAEGAGTSKRKGAGLTTARREGAFGVNRKLRGLIFTIPGVVIGVASATSCEKISPEPPIIDTWPPCGPCGSVLVGDSNPSGDPMLDGFLQAVGNLQNATASIQGDFQANVVALAKVYGVNASNGFDPSLVDDVIEAMKADVAQDLDGGLRVSYRSPSCQADVEIAAQAQARCEKSALCDVTANQGQSSVKCSGTCDGSCSGQCSGALSCTVMGPTANCEGTCEGVCELSAAASCDGTCHGKCSDGCSATDAKGDCQGSCRGTCAGSCELKAPAKCTGTCHGRCRVNQDSAQCTGDAQCSGKCDAQCSGGCQGDFDPPSASVSCEASVKCRVQARAQAKAALKCQPARLDLDYAFKTGATAADQAEFVVRLGQLKVRAAAIVNGAARLSAVVTGKVDGQVVFDPPPLAELADTLRGFSSADAIARLDIPVGRLVCIVPAFVQAGTALGKLGSSTLDTINAQAKFVSYITTGS